MSIVRCLVDLFFRCRHRTLSRVFTPRGAGPRAAYVYCFDCGRRLGYDLVEMRLDASGYLNRS